MKTNKLLTIYLFIMLALFFGSCKNQQINGKYILDYVRKSVNMDVGKIIIYKDNIYLEHSSLCTWTQWGYWKNIDRVDVVGCLYEFNYSTWDIKQVGVEKYSVFGIDDEFMYFDNIKYSKSDGSKEYIDYHFGQPTPSLWAITPDEDEIWVGSFRRGVSRYNKNQNILEMYHSKTEERRIINYYVYDILKNDTYVCIIGNNGIDLYNKKEDEWRSYKINNLSYESIIVDNRIIITWFEDEKYYVYQFNLITGKFSKYLNDEFESIVDILVSGTTSYILSQDNLYIFRNKILLSKIPRWYFKKVSEQKISFLTSLGLHGDKLLIGTDKGLFILIQDNN